MSRDHSHRRRTGGILFGLAPAIAVTGGALIKSITKFADGPEGMRKAVRELIAAVPDNKPGPLAGAALGAHMLMCRAVLQPGWGDFVSRSDHLSNDSAYVAAVRRTTLAGRAVGDFSFKSAKAAVDFQIGAVMGAMRRLVASSRCSTACCALPMTACNRRSQAACATGALRLTTQVRSTLRTLSASSSSAFATH